MRILITNDDGIHAPGLRVAEDIASALSGGDGEIWVVAPQAEQSGASRSLSLASPIRLQQTGERRFAVRGTPADCVIIAVCHLMPRMPDIIISGVNRGQNVADDVTYSGTIAAAMEGAVLGIPSFALSQCYAPHHANAIPWQVARAHGAAAIRMVLDALAAAPAYGDNDHSEHRPALFNINFPDCPPQEMKGFRLTRQGRRDVQQLRVDARTDPRGQPYFWLSFRREVNNPPQDTDLFAIFNGYTSITPLKMNLTDEDALRHLAPLIGKARQNA